MAEVLVDSNVLLDVVTEDPRWFSWSSDALARCAEEATLVVNPIIFAEVSIGFDRIWMAAIISGVAILSSGM